MEHISTSILGFQKQMPNVYIVIKMSWNLIQISIIPIIFF